MSIPMNEQFGNDHQHEQSYARLNNEYGPVSNDVRHSYGYGADDYAADLNQLKSKQSSKHLRSFFAWFIFWGGEGAMIGLYLGDILDVQVGALIGICVGIYVFYLMLGLICNPLLSYLANIEHGANFQNQYNRVRNIEGQFKFHAECYHYETRYHTRTVTENGNTRTQTYTTQQKVITHTATEYVHPSRTVDDSGNVDRVQAEKDIIFVRFIVSYRFFDDRSRYTFDHVWNNFRMRHRRDIHQDYSYNYELPSLKPRMTFYVGQQPKNYYCGFVVASIFGCIWPYSMSVEKNVNRFHLDFMKILTM